MESINTVYLVDDDDAVRISLSRFLKHHSFNVIEFNSGTSFLDALPGGTYGCIVLDVAMPGMSGLEVQTELAERDNQLPIIFMTGHGDIPTSVRALKGGAIDFLEKPFDLDVMLERINEAFKLDKERLANDQQSMELRTLFKTLTNREVDVMKGLVAGLANRSNKEVARSLGISHRTVEEYRARIFNKLNASSITHLVEIAKVCGIYSKDDPTL